MSGFIVHCWEDIMVFLFNRIYTQDINCMALNYGNGFPANPRTRLIKVFTALFLHFLFHLFPQQCCQLAEISAAEHKSGRTKIAVVGKIRGRIFCRFSQNGRKEAKLKLVLQLNDTIFTVKFAYSPYFFHTLCGRNFCKGQLNQLLCKNN
jgi:hypothetical protein